MRGLSAGGIELPALLRHLDGIPHVVLGPVVLLLAGRLAGT